MQNHAFLSTLLPLTSQCRGLLHALCKKCICTYLTSLIQFSVFGYFRKRIVLQYEHWDGHFVQFVSVHRTFSVQLMVPWLLFCFHFVVAANVYTLLTFRLLVVLLVEVIPTRNRLSSYTFNCLVVGCAFC